MVKLPVQTETRAHEQDAEAANEVQANLQRSKEVAIEAEAKDVHEHADIAMLAYSATGVNPIRIGDILELMPIPDRFDNTVFTEYSGNFPHEQNEGVKAKDDRQIGPVLMVRAWRTIDQAQPKYWVECSSLADSHSREHSILQNID